MSWVKHTKNRSLDNVLQSHKSVTCDLPNSVHNLKYVEWFADALMRYLLYVFIPHGCQRLLKCDQSEEVTAFYFCYLSIKFHGKWFWLNANKC